MDQVDLSHWDTVDILTAQEAISLAVGYEPALDDFINLETEGRRVLLMRHMEDAHGAAMVWAAELTKRATTLGIGEKLAAALGVERSPPVDGRLPLEFDGWTMNMQSRVGRNGLLFTIDVQESFDLLANGKYVPAPRGTIATLFAAIGQLNKPHTMVKLQRKHFQDWLDHIGWQSPYSFNSKSAIAIEGETHGVQGPCIDNKPRWPWGAHDTKLLRALEQTAKKWWVHYDPADHTTAPTNEAVIAWVIAQGLASENIAKAIASILRADGLPSGPRK